MNVEAPKRESPLQIGQMPKPKFLKIPSPFGNGAKPIGIEAFSPFENFQKKPYIWKENVGKIDLTNDSDREEIARFLTRIIVDKGVDVVVGPAISLRKSNPETESVKTIFDHSNTIGIYADPQKRVLLSWSQATGGLLSEEELRSKLLARGDQSSIAFDIVLVHVRYVLPRPVGNSPRR